MATEKWLELMRVQCGWSELARKGANIALIPELAKLNKMDISNPFALNGLLKAIKEQLPY